LTVADAIRKEAPKAVENLTKMGVHIVMLTGDRKAPAEAIGKSLKIPEIRAELLPEDKLSAVDDLTQKALKGRKFLTVGGFVPGGVAMVGDGINDAAALSAASVGIAMGAAGSHLAMENAHVTLMDSNLEKLAFVVNLAKDAVFKIQVNIVFALVTKAVMVSLTFAGYASLWGAIVVDLGSMLIVTMHSSTMLSKRKKAPSHSAHGHSHGGHGHSHGGKPCGAAQPSGGHGDSHGGKPCGGHGGAAQPSGGHGHSHGGKPCGGHGGAAQSTPTEKNSVTSSGGHGHSHGDKPCCGH